MAGYISVHDLLWALINMLIKEVLGERSYR